MEELAWKPPTDRFYYLPLGTACLEGCAICASLACRAPRERDLSDVSRVIDKAKRAEFTAVLFPAGLLLRPDANALVRLARANGLQPILQLDVGCLTYELLEKITELFDGAPSLNLVFTGVPSSRDWLPVVQKCESFADYTIVPRKNVNLAALLKLLPASILERVRFHALPMNGPRNLDANRLTVRETHKLFKRLKQSFPSLEVRPPRGHEVWDERIPDDLGLEPDCPPRFVFDIAGARPEISVIIPSYNSGRVLKNVVKHLLDQTLPRERYEIILVDDGSTDGTEDLIRTFVAPEASHLCFKFIRFPRPRARKMGDNHFRAGIARNLGVKHARGRLLCFLDADIIVGRDHLEKLIELHRKHDVIQCVRLHLRDQSSNEYVNYEDVDPRPRAKQAFVLEARYWKQFFETKEWASLPFFWKYTCTYAFSLSAEHFKSAGWFRRTFVYYGFEDTDLGYRLARQGRRFHLSPAVTYHLSQGNERSEYRGSSFERQMLLAKTAKVFYLNNLDPEIYRHFQSFMGGESGPSLWIPRYKQWLRGRAERHA